MDKRVLDRIEELYIKQGYNIYEISEASNLERTTVYRWYHQNAEPTADSLERVAKTLGVTVSQLYAFGQTIDLDPLEKDDVLTFIALSKNDKEAVKHIIHRLKKR